MMAAWQAVFAAQANTDIAIYQSDPANFAAALLAAWLENKTVVLPGDLQAPTLAALAAADCLLAADLPGALRPKVASAAWRVGREIDPQRARVRIFTSGSHGDPLGIDKRLVQLTAETDALESLFGPTLTGCRADLPLVWASVSHQHIYGLLFSILWPLSAGRPTVSLQAGSPTSLPAGLRAEPSVLVATPAYLKRLPAGLDWQWARSGLRAVFSSGGPLLWPDAQSATQVLGKVPIEVFGSSETGGVAWRQCLSNDEPWQAFPDMQWRIDQGRLCLRSARLEGANWFITSDRAELTHNGALRLLGREDQVVKIEAQRVSLRAIERRLLETPWVEEARALVIETSVGERVGVVVVPTALGREQLALGAQVLSKLLRHALSSALARVALPRRWRYVAALPRNAQGKTPESLVKELFKPSPNPVSRPDMPAVTWLEIGVDHASACLDIHAGLQVFAGHFPQEAILPGVAILDWTIALARVRFALPSYFLRFEALKFTLPVRAGTALLLHLELKAMAENAEVKSLVFKLTSHDAHGAELRNHASGRAIWSHRPGPAHG